jgi:hypothetical protein
MTAIAARPARQPRAKYVTEDQFDRVRRVIGLSDKTNAKADADLTHNFAILVEAAPLLLEMATDHKAAKDLLAAESLVAAARRKRWARRLRWFRGPHRILIALVVAGSGFAGIVLGIAEMQAAVQVVKGALHVR